MRGSWEHLAIYSSRNPHIQIDNNSVLPPSFISLKMEFMKWQATEEGKESREKTESKKTNGRYESRSESSEGWSESSRVEKGWQQDDCSLLEALKSITQLVSIHFFLLGLMLRYNLFSVKREAVAAVMPTFH